MISLALAPLSEVMHLFGGSSRPSGTRWLGLAASRNESGPVKYILHMFLEIERAVSL